MARSLRLIAAVALGLALASVPDVRVAACDCSLVTPQEAVGHSEAAFVGTVMGIEEVPAVAPEIAGAAVYTFGVEGVAKGNLLAETSVFAGGDSAGCGMTFGANERWLIFGDFDGAYLTTHLCAGNVPLAAGEEPPLPLTAPREAFLSDPAPEVPWPLIGIGTALAVVVIVSIWAFRRAGSAS